MDVGTGIEEQPRNLDDVPRELAAAGIPGDVMEQGRAGEVVVGRIEIRPRVDQGGVRLEQIAQPSEIAGIEGGDRGLEVRMRSESGDVTRDLDVMLEPCPVVESILSGEYTLSSARVSGVSSTDSNGWPFHRGW